LLVAAFPVLSGLRAIRRQVTLARDGVAVDAVITRIVRDSLGRCRASFQFEAGDGPHRGSSLIGHRQAKLADLRVGSRLPAFFDPQRPNCNELLLAFDGAVEFNGIGE
jgi:hypothetical protein